MGAMHTRNLHSLPAKQRGVALAFGLLILLIITVIGIAALRGSLFELQMARNEESRVTALERAQSIIDATVAVASNLVVAGSVGNTNCVGSAFSGCTTSSVSLDTAMSSGAFQNRSSVRVERLAPEFAPAPRIVGSSVNVFEAAQFRVESTYDARNTREGRASLAQGVMVLVATGQQGTVSGTP
jgi:Na+-transporting methylmalonyl-CoA/oxaloacetate decarboxylase gamma subunit